MPAYLEFSFLVPDDGEMPPERLRQILANVRQRVGAECCVTVTGPRRSIKANRFYRGFILRPALAGLQASGFRLTEDTAHDYMKHTKLPMVARMVAEGGGEMPPYVEETVWPDGSIRARYTTTKLDETTFSYFISAVMLDEDVQAAGVDFDGLSTEPTTLLAHPELKRSRSYDLETEGAPTYDVTDLPEYPRAAVIHDGEGPPPEPLADEPFAEPAGPEHAADGAGPLRTGDPGVDYDAADASAAQMAWLFDNKAR